VTRALGAAVSVLGVLLLAEAITVATGLGWGGDVDVDRTGRIELGLAFGVVAVFLLAGARALFRRLS